MILIFKRIDTKNGQIVAYIEDFMKWIQKLKQTLMSLNR